MPASCVVIQMVQYCFGRLPSNEVKRSFLVVNDRYQKTDTDTDTDISVKKPILTKPIPILNRYFGNFYYHGFWTNLYYCIGLFSTKTSR